MSRTVMNDSYDSRSGTDREESQEGQPWVSDISLRWDLTYTMYWTTGLTRHLLARFNKQEVHKLTYLSWYQRAMPTASTTTCASPHLNGQGAVSSSHLRGRKSNNLSVSFTTSIHDIVKVRKTGLMPIATPIVLFGISLRAISSRATWGAYSTRIPGCITTPVV